MALTYDEIVVGAGSSGAVLAARLSEDPDQAVLLLEAGPDFPTVEQIPPILRDPRVVGVPKFDWDWYAVAASGRTVAVPRGKVVGGSSAVNGAIALRGIPSDFDQWAAWGNDKWAWRHVVPYFRRLEDDQDEFDDFHGAGGPIPIHRAQPDDLIPLQRAFLDTCRELGFAETSDHNHPESSGIGPLPRNIRGGIRISTAIGYLHPARQRLNLTIRPHALVNRVLIEHDRAVGVEVECGGMVQQVFGRRVALAAGAYASPAILLRSGIGPKVDLLDLGITPIVDLPGVGANLIDHPQIGFNLLTKPEALDSASPMFQMLLRYTAPGSGEAADMQLYMMHFPESMTTRLSAVLQRPHARGRLTLTSADPHTQPRIELNLAAEPEDMRRLVEGVRLLWAVARSPRIAAAIADEVTLDDGAVLPFADAAAAAATDAALEAYVRRGVDQFYHPVGTARMGPPGDPNAVVDQYGRVRGVAQLRVVDASIMPNIPSANTNLTCIMIGERIADWMRAEP